MTEPAYEEQEGPRITDRRRIDPDTGELRQQPDAQPDTPADPAEATADVPAGDAAAPSGPEAELSAQLAERTADLQRVSAEFANYRKRVERDRAAVAEQALASVLVGLLPVLDDIDRAR